MRWKMLILAALAMPACQAQQVYKVVGADGRITFTDRPPPASPAQAVTPFGGRAPARPAPAVPAARGPIEAALQVYYKQIIVHSAKELCRQLGSMYPDLPGVAATAATAAQAGTQWQQRHAALAQQQIVVLQDQFTRAELLRMADDARIENNSYVSRLSRQPPAEQLGWCAQFPKTLASLEFDLASNPVLVRQLMDYKPVKHALENGDRRRAGDQ